MLKMDFVWTLAPCTKSANLIIERHVWSSPEYHLSSLQWVLPHLLPILWYVVATRRKLAGKKFQPTFLEFSLSFHGIRATYLQKKYQIFKRRAAAQAVVYSSSRHYSNCFYMAADRNTNQANICDSQSHRSLCFCVYGPPQKIKYLKCTFQ